MGNGTLTPAKICGLRGGREFAFRENEAPDHEILARRHGEIVIRSLRKSKIFHYQFGDWEYQRTVYVKPLTASAQ